MQCGHVLDDGTGNLQAMSNIDVIILHMPLSAFSWLAMVENTKWLQSISALLRATLVVVNAVHREHRPVLVHCSDGWDRTPQVVALAELLLDPFYRTLEVRPLPHSCHCMHSLQLTFLFPGIPSACRARVAGIRPQVC